MCGEWACVGEGGVRCVRPRGCFVWLVVLCLCGACAPCPLLLVGGRRGACGGAVRAENAGLCVVETWGLSPRTPVEAVQGGDSPVGVDARQRMGFFCSRR